MATQSKLHESQGVAKEGVIRVQCYAVVLFVGGLFWRAICVAKEGVVRIPWSTVVLIVGRFLLTVIVALGRACNFLAQFIEKLAQFIEKVDAVTPAPPPIEELPPPYEAVNVRFVKQEVSSNLGQGIVVAEKGNWAPRAKVEQGPAVRVHRELCGEPSAPLDPVEIYIPHFHCQVYCHRVWKKFYAVYHGRQPGIYNCWECAKLQVEGYSGQDHKSFPGLLAAEEYFRLKLHCRQNH